MESRVPVYKQGNGKLKVIQKWRRADHFPSPPVGEGGSPRSGETGEGFYRHGKLLRSSRLAERTPHPALRAIFSHKGRRIYTARASFPYVNNVGCCLAARSWASTTATAVMLRMPRAVTDGVRMCAGRAGPIRIGPTGSASASDLII